MATRPDDLTSPHMEPNHYERYGFCRVGCEECDRLDREEMGQGMPTAEALSRGVMLALAAVDGESTVSREDNGGDYCKACERYYLGAHIHESRPS